MKLAREGDPLALSFLLFPPSHSSSFSRWFGRHRGVLLVAFRYLTAYRPMTVLLPTPKEPKLRDRSRKALQRVQLRLRRAFSLSKDISSIFKSARSFIEATCRSSSAPLAEDSKALDEACEHWRFGRVDLSIQPSSSRAKRDG